MPFYTDDFNSHDNPFVQDIWNNSTIQKCFFVFDSVDPQRYKKTLSDFLGVKLLHFITTQKLLQNIDTVIKPVLENIIQNRKNTKKLKEENDE